MAKSNGTDQPAHHKNAAETKTKGAATSYDSHGGICGPFFITLLGLGIGQFYRYDMCMDTK